MHLGQAIEDPRPHIAPAILIMKGGKVARGIAETYQSLDYSAIVVGSVDG